MKKPKRKAHAGGGLVTSVAPPSGTYKDYLPRGNPNADPGMMGRNPTQSEDSNVLQWESMPQGRGRPGTEGLSKGGKVLVLQGPKPKGKDDGFISAKKGEYVIKKDSVTKYGPAKMAAVNKGSARISSKKK